MTFYQIEKKNKHGKWDQAHGIGPIFDYERAVERYKDACKYSTCTEIALVEYKVSARIIESFKREVEA